MRMGMLKTLVAGASALALTLAVAGSAGAADKPLYGVLMKTLSNPFWGAMEKGVEEGANKAGVDYFLQAVESDQAAEPQLNTCNTMLEKKPAVMITAAINSTILLPCLKHANELKIPVVDLDGNLDPEITKKAGVEVAFHIGSDNEAAGAKGADYLVSALGKDAKGPVLVIEGLSGNITGAKRAHGFADELKKAAPGLNIVASLPGDWDSLKAANITNDTLQRNPDLVAIFCANDDMALGAVEVGPLGRQGQADRHRRRRQLQRGQVDPCRTPQRLGRATAIPGRHAGGRERQEGAGGREGSRVHLCADLGADQGGA